MNCNGHRGYEFLLGLLLVLFCALVLLWLPPLLLEERETLHLWVWLDPRDVCRACLVLNGAVLRCACLLILFSSLLGRRLFFRRGCRLVRMLALHVSNRLLCLLLLLLLLHLLWRLLLRLP